MNLNEITPRANETLAQWLRRVDPAAAELLHQQEPLADQHSAYRVGNAVGSWAVLHEGFKLLEHECDARRLLMLLLAGQVGLRNRRGDVRTVTEFLASLRDAENGGGESDG
jgi:hypothetical protein